MSITATHPGFTVDSLEKRLQLTYQQMDFVNLNIRIGFVVAVALFAFAVAIGATALYYHFYQIPFPEAFQATLDISKYGLAPAYLAFVSLALSNMVGRVELLYKPLEKKEIVQILDREEINATYYLERAKAREKQDSIKQETLTIEEIKKIRSEIYA